VTFTVHIPPWLGWMVLGAVIGLALGAAVVVLAVGRAWRDAIGRGLGW
jgi:hypothetical protein